MRFSDKNLVAYLLGVANQSHNSKKAYDVFLEVVSVVNTSVEADVFDPISLYLSFQGAFYRDVLLCCLADQEVVLEDSTLLRTISALCSDPDRSLARSAAAALDAGGHKAQDTLSEALSQLPDPDCGDFVALIHSI